MEGCCAPSPVRDSRPDRLSSVIFAPEDVQTKLAQTAVPLAGGRFLMGTNSAEACPLDGEGPVRAVVVSPFRMQPFAVTNQQFGDFVSATGYETDAEQLGWSFVFWDHLQTPYSKKLPEGVATDAPWWCKVAEACWKTPEGPGSTLVKRQDHPVVHVSWNDAMAYCRWSAQRLPTEAEWEYAARGGLEQKLYPWGDKLRPKGEHRCNIWQGEFPRVDKAEDGYSGTCPVNTFPPNGYDLFCMTGNTWEWCADWFSAEHDCFTSPENLKGPSIGAARVMKGGSFLCHKSYCNRYRVAARTSSPPDTSSSNVSFRCVAP